MRNVSQQGRSPRTGQDKETIIPHFRFADLFGPGQVLALHPVLGTLSHLVYQDQRPLLLAQEQFTTSEVNVLLPLLEAYPQYCPYEVLLAHFEIGHVTEETIHECRKRLYQAQEHGTWEETMNPLRTTLSRVRLKIRHFGLEVASISETGYLLKRSTRLLETV